MHPITRLKEIRSLHVPKYRLRSLFPNLGTETALVVKFIYLSLCNKHSHMRRSGHLATTSDANRTKQQAKMGDQRDDRTAQSPSRYYSHAGR